MTGPAAKALALILTLSLGGCATVDYIAKHKDVATDLTGAWRESVQFQSGPFASISNLEFMIVFNRGGTMTESSNYDGAPPVPPAYGIWRKTGNNTYAAHYEFYITKLPGKPEEIIKNGGFAPAGRGVFSETITMAADGLSYTSTLRFESRDASGNTATGEAKGSGGRINFAGEP